MTASLIALATSLFCLALNAQAPAGWPDDRLNHLSGSWKMEGKVMGNGAHHDVRADWVLNHQFIRITQRTSADAPAGERPYDSIW